jgi:hypothetical protein
MSPNPWLPMEHLDALSRCGYAQHVRTTIRIDDALYRRAKEYAARSGRTVGEVIEDALRASLQPRRGEDVRDLPDLPVFGGSGTMPGVDLTDEAALRDLMDERGSLDALR